MRKVTPPVPLETLRKLCEYFPAPQGQYKLDPSYEFTSDTPDPTKVPIMKDLQKMQGVGLVVPVDEEFMYFAAMNSKGCRLTALGYQYWRLAKEKNSECGFKITESAVERADSCVSSQYR